MANLLTLPKKIRRLFGLEKNIKWYRKRIHKNYLTWLTPDERKNLAILISLYTYIKINDRKEYDMLKRSVIFRKWRKSYEEKNYHDIIG